MNTIIPSLTNRSRNRSAVASPESFRRPNYECREQADALELVVYVPGVDSSDVEIAASGPDLTVTARKHHFVRINFNALHLEGAQRDYRLTLRLGRNFDYANLHAEIREGVLTILLPKRGACARFERLRHAA